MLGSCSVKGLLSAPDSDSEDVLASSSLEESPFLLLRLCLPPVFLLLFSVLRRYGVEKLERMKLMFLGRGVWVAGSFESSNSSWMRMAVRSPGIS